ncbi:MAG: RdgB/HAM1 family non-canonical purine NTP pyrophosphatase [Rhodospirillales bacterium]|jgi:XTP/dITP diphosphohydrolase|nr:RdgB/HAM1 family non-canonical purine NTP pyrophosphatase [Rhodospirillales bacterium]HIJ44157.1 RdgB/HAM1 family non-canonical purine NTP pyrophosphatase [Rhodospirillaceae bacterium]MDP7097197.1 RdgB/HAM1 family non-canonical purine NTP pyrophosphatase [Rhodospirillales bacterium]MDP7215052.1 RdgB/HAM1 family non-canonical purine NTP pyrophosphatase [Rhodospirillales bacterium]HIJ46047.1 RdgB/HAM1 family non-canonical purine NTP pyrophosphatase [Rhodospirillaceae bacterium]
MTDRLARRFEAGKLVIASHNQGKVREIAELLAPFRAEALSAAELALPAPAENGKTFLANAEIKAKAAAEASGLPALADDSGLMVAALGGAPGVHSSRWAGPGGDFAAAMKKLEEAMAGKEDRRARFACVLALCWPDGHCRTFEGFVHGRLVWPPRGTNGFGYDPVFVADGHGVTFGEMDAADKQAISHRAEAFRKLIKACFEN